MVIVNYFLYYSYLLFFVILICEMLFNYVRITMRLNTGLLKKKKKE